VPPGTRVLAVVKAGGYGHGARPVARAALEAGAWGLAVSTVEEANEVLGLCPPQQVLVLGGLAPAEMAAAAATGCALTCYSREQLVVLEAAALPVPVHLKIDTGMGRLGCTPAEAPALARAIWSSSRLRLAGTYTHFAAADSDPELTKRQLDLFRRTVAALGVEPGLQHAGNSAAVWRHPEAALDAVRVGISLYGCGGPGLRPTLALRALVTHVKDVAAGQSVGYGATWRPEAAARVATVALGYEDGVHRARSNRGEVLIHGQRAPLVGRVSMDSLTADVSLALQTQVGDVATVIGADGDERITAEEVAGWSGTIPNEVLTSIGARVERRYSE
jgi:alanine racemase